MNNPMQTYKCTNCTYVICQSKCGVQQTKAVNVEICLTAKEYGTEPQFLQLSQNLTIDSLLLIYVFCTSCEHEIIFVLICRAGRKISGSQFVQNMEIDRESGLIEEIMALSCILLAALPLNNNSLFLSEPCRYQGK